MFIKYLASITAVFGVLIASCAPSQLDQNWGRSAETARYNQIFNPDAGQDSRPVEGIDGHSAVNSFNAYRNSFTPQESSSGDAIKVTGLGVKH